MSGHSKWATIKRKKAVTDTRRGKLFTQLIREITISAKAGGGDPGGNPRLRLAIDKGKAANMPAENIKRAIQKGTGELPGVNYEEITYEAYGPGGTAIIIEVVTDNKNRTIAELRFLLERNGGKLGASGSVAYMFHKKGTIHIPHAGLTEDDVLAVVLDAGADDLVTDAETYEITTTLESFEPVKKALDSQHIAYIDADVSMIPENTVRVEGHDAEKLLKLMDAIEDHDDTQHVYANFDIDEKILALFGN